MLLSETLLGVGSGDGSGGFGFNSCAARCSAGGRSRSFFDLAGDVGVSSFPFFLGKRVGTWDIPVGARFVWAAESFSDGRLFFRSSVVRPAMADLLFLSYHVRLTADRRSAESMRLVKYRALALAALPRFGVPWRHGRRIWKLQVETMANETPEKSRKMNSSFRASL